MKSRSVGPFGLFLLSLLAITQVVWAKVDYSQEMYTKLTQTQNAIPQIKIPVYQKQVLKNGLVVYLVEDHDLPLVLIKGFVAHGKEIETAQNVGVADLMIELMNDGTLRLSKTERGLYIQRHALDFKLKANEHNFSFSGNSLAAEQDALLFLSAETLASPDFDVDYFSRIKVELEQGLKQLGISEDGLLYRYFYQNILPGRPCAYGSNYQLQLANLDKLTPAKVMRFYRQSFLPNQTVLFVYGDFKTTAMLKLVENYFGNWAKGATKISSVKLRENQKSFGQIFLVDKADAAQAKIMMGYQFYNTALFEHDFDSAIAFQIGNQILGGGDAGSYLMDRLRLQKGYVYSIYSNYVCNRSDGEYHISTSVKPEYACDTVLTIKKVLEEVKAGKRQIAPEEVYRIINQRNAFFPDDFRKNDQIIASIIEDVELKKRDPNYLNQYIQKYNQVTAVKAQAALERYLFPEKLVTVIVGKKEVVLPAFKEAGIAVTVVK